jgi:hypothetical protein
MDRLAKPPRVGKGRRAEGASETMDKWATLNMKSRLEEDMKLVKRKLTSDADEGDRKELLDVDLVDYAKWFSDKTPVLWDLLRFLSWTTPKQDERNTSNPDMVRSINRCGFDQ